MPASSIECGYASCQYIGDCYEGADRKRNAPLAYCGAPRGSRAVIRKPHLFPVETEMHGMGNARQEGRLVNGGRSSFPSSRETPGAYELHPKHLTGKSSSSIAPLCLSREHHPARPSQPRCEAIATVGLDRANRPSWSIRLQHLPVPRASRHSQSFRLIRRTDAPPG